MLSDALFGKGLEVALGLELIDALVDGLSENGSLLDLSLAITTANANTVDDKALFGLKFMRTS